MTLSVRQRAERRRLAVLTARTGLLIGRIAAVVLTSSLLIFAWSSPDPTGDRLLWILAPLTLLLLALTHWVCLPLTVIAFAFVGRRTPPSLLALFAYLAAVGTGCVVWIGSPT